MPLEDVNYNRQVQYASMDTKKLKEIKEKAYDVAAVPEEETKEKPVF